MLNTGERLRSSVLSRFETMAKVPLARTKILEKCWRLETLADEMYGYLSRLHRGERTISRLWKKTAQEEEDHALQIRHLMKDKEGIVEDIMVEGDRLNGVVEALETAFRDMKKNPPSIRKALTEAIELEESFSEFHLENAINFPDEESRELFQALRKIDQIHVKALRKALEEWEGD